MDFLPIVLGNGRIHLEVEPRISALDAAAGTTITVPNIGPGFGAGIGMGLAIVGIGIGIGLVGYAALSGIARAFDVDFTPYLTPKGMDLYRTMQDSSIVHVLGQPPYRGLTWTDLVIGDSVAWTLGAYWPATPGLPS